MSRPYTAESFLAHLELIKDAGLAALETQRKGDFEEACKCCRWVEENLLRERDRK